MKWALIAVACGALLVMSAIVKATSSPTVWPFGGNHGASPLLSFSDAAKAVPESATLSLLGAGFLGGAYLARKRRRKESPPI